MPIPKIIIADSKEKSRRRLKDTLVKAGYNVQTEAQNFPELLRKVRTMYPDLVIIDYDLEGGSVFELAAIIEHDNLSSTLIIADQLKGSQIKNYAHIIKPFNDETLLTVVEISLFYSTKFTTMRKEVDQLKGSINDRKLIEKAKGILMKNLGLDEPEAYRKMQKLSMDKSLSMKEIAKKIIKSEEKNKE